MIIEKLLHYLLHHVEYKLNAEPEQLMCVGFLEKKPRPNNGHVSAVRFIFKRNDYFETQFHREISGHVTK